MLLTDTLNAAHSVNNRPVKRLTLVARLELNNLNCAY